MAASPSPSETLPPDGPPGKELVPGSLRELLTVAIPLVLSSGSLTACHVIDRLFLTWYSKDALAASLPSGALQWTMMSAFVGMINYGNAFVAQYEGARQKDRVTAAVWQGIFLAIAAGSCFLFLIPLAPTLFALVGHEAHVQELETQFFGTLCLGAVPMLLTMAFGCFYSGRGKTRVVMLVDFLLAGTNIALDPLLIFGLGPFPKLGIRGAALATDTAYVVATLAYLVLSFKHRDSIAYGFWKHVRFDRELAGRLLRYGLPTGLQMTAEISAFSVFLFLLGRLGTQDLAASNLAFNMNMLSFIPMIGVGTAVMTLVGRRIGEGRPELATRTTWLAAGTTASYMAFFAIVFVAFPETILWPFTGLGSLSEMAAIREQVVVLLRFVAIYTFFDGMAIVFAYAIRGAGDTRFPFIYTLVTAWSIMVLPTYLIVRTGHGGLLGCWTACSIYICLLGSAFLLRFLQGKWKTMKVIGPAASETATLAASIDEPGSTPPDALSRSTRAPDLSSASPVRD